MPSSHRPSPITLATVAPWVGYLALAVLGLQVVDAFVPDDAFIHYRYARNLVNGEGWGYNPGSTSNAGATSPGWVLLLAALARVLGSVPRAADVLFVLCLTVAAGSTFAALRAVGRPAAGVVSGALVVVAPLLLATRGMESPMYVAAAAVAWWATARQRPAAAGLALGVLVLARPDGVVVAAGVGGWWLLRERAIPWRLAGAAAAPVVLWSVYAWGAFGDPLPGTLAAKVAQGDSGFWVPLFTGGLVRIWSVFGFGDWAVSTLALAVAGSVTLLPADQRETRRLVGAALVAVVLLTIAYGPVLGVPAYHWYYALPALVLALAAGLPLGFAVHHGLVLAGDRTAGIVRLGGGVLVASVIGAVLLVMIGGLRAVPSRFPTPHYVSAAAFIEERSQPGVSVAITEIGAFGWAGEQLEVVDYLGLLDRRAAEHLAAGDLAWWLGEYEPDWWVVHDPPWPFETPAMDAPAFRAYERVPDDIPELAFYRRSRSD